MEWGYLPPTPPYYKKFRKKKLQPFLRQIIYHSLEGEIKFSHMLRIQFPVLHKCCTSLWTSKDDYWYIFKLSASPNPPVPKPPPPQTWFAIARWIWLFWLSPWNECTFQLFNYNYCLAQMPHSFINKQRLMVVYCLGWSKSKSHPHAPTPFNHKPTLSPSPSSQTALLWVNKDD